MDRLRSRRRYAIRGLRRTPGFTFVAILTLALGIGANTAIFSVINAALIKPLPFPRPDRLVFLWNTRPGGDIEPLGPGRMLDFRSQSTSFSGFAGISHMSFTVTGSGEPERGTDQRLVDLFRRARGASAARRAVPFERCRSVGGGAERRSVAPPFRGGPRPHRPDHRSQQASAPCSGGHAARLRVADDHLCAPLRATSVPSCGSRRRGRHTASGDQRGRRHDRQPQRRLPACRGPAQAGCAARAGALGDRHDWRSPLPRASRGRLARRHSRIDASAVRRVARAPAAGACRGGGVRSGYRLRQRGEPAPRPRRGAHDATWRCGARLAPIGRGSSASC